MILRTCLLLTGACLAFAGCVNTPVPLAREGIPDSTGPAEAKVVDVAPSQGLDPALLQAPAEPYRLGPGDVVDIEIMGNPGSHAPATVGPDGKIYYSLLSGTDVWGLTLAEARDRIADGLKTFIREKPVVSISLRTAASRRYWILGRVGSPGAYPLMGPTTLLDAIAQSGGLGSSSALSTLAASLGVNAPGSAPESADLGRSFVIRNGKAIPVDFHGLLIDGDMTQNIYLQPGDFVYFPSASVPQIHILGAVVHPQSARLAGPLTAVEAIALAGGAMPGAYLQNVAIVRGSLTHPKIAILDVGRVLHGKDRDLSLEAGDIVYVPSSPYSTLARYANLVLDTFARTVGVNAGSHAAGGAAVGVGVSVSP